MSPSYGPKCHRRDDRSYIVFALVPPVPPFDPHKLCACHRCSGWGPFEQLAHITCSFFFENKKTFWFPTEIFPPEGEFPSPPLGQSTPPRHSPPSSSNPARLSSWRSSSHQSGAAGTNTATTQAKPPPVGNRGARQCEARNVHQPEERPPQRRHRKCPPSLAGIQPGQTLRTRR